MAETELGTPEVNPATEIPTTPDAVAGEVLSETNGEVADASEEVEVHDGLLDHKRKIGELDLDPEDQAPEKKRELSISDAATEVLTEEAAVGAPDNGVLADEGSKVQSADVETDHEASNEGNEVQKVESISLVGDGKCCSLESSHDDAKENIQDSTNPTPQDVSLPFPDQQSSSDISALTRNIGIPNAKVGVLIGKAGDTIKSLQFRSGASIQITRDIDTDPSSSTRTVKLSGKLESIDMAERLIKDVISAEADAEGSPTRASRVFAASHTVTEQVEMQVPNEKVGMIIGKGGEKIKNMQMRSGARIRLITQGLPEGDTSKEKTVKITGNKMQIESAMAMIKDVMSQVPTRSPHHQGSYNQHGFRPQGHSSQLPWGPRAQHHHQHTGGYNYQQRMHPPQSALYPQGHGAYAQQRPPRSSMGAGWDQRSAAPAQHHHQAGGYDYYGQGGQAQNAPPSNPMAGSAPASNPSTYNYGQPQAPSYGQSVHAQQSYGQAYDQVKYDNQASNPQFYGQAYDQVKYDNQATNPQFYGQQPASAQPAAYGQHVSATQPGYMQQQQPYNNQAYGAQGVTQPFASQSVAQPGEPSVYQGSTQSYGSYGQPSTQQSYPYGPGTPSQQAPAYGQSYGPSVGAAEGYSQPMYGYAQGQQNTQTMPNYAPGSQSGGYGQYPSQASYNGQSMPNNAAVYQGGSGTENYSNPGAGYGNAAPVTNQAAYGQQQAGYAAQNTSGFDQSVPAQTSYGNNSGAAPVGYT